MSDSRSAAAPSVTASGAGVSVPRRFTAAGEHPFDCVEWEIRDALIGDPANPAFEQRGVEFPATWSQNATNIVAQKYFRGRMDSPERESSVKQMIGRVAGTIAGWGREGGYFASDEDAQAFEDELTHILLHQMAAFNSPVWFNVGFEEHPQCSACQPYHAKVSTPDGMVAIGDLVEGHEIGREVYDANGTTRVVAVKANGRKHVRRVRLRNGNYVEATPDHLVRAVAERRTTPEWLPVDQLKIGMRMHLHPHRAKVAAPVAVPAGAVAGDTESTLPDFGSPRSAACAEAALAGWLQADGFVGQYESGTNRSLTIEFQVASEAEYEWVVENLDIAMPEVHRHVTDVESKDESLNVRRIRLYGEPLRDFVERWELLARGTDIRVPSLLWTASHDEVAAYLRSVFQADGYVTVRRERGQESGRIGFAVIGELWTEDIQLLLNTIGIYSRRKRKLEKRTNRHHMHELSISIGSERARFSELIGFVSPEKQGRLFESLRLQNTKACPDVREEEIVAIEDLGEMEVYDIQTESGEYLSNNVAVHNCFILSVEDTIESILDWNTKEGMIFRGGSGSGINLSRIRGSSEHLSKGGLASGPVSFMRGADAWAGTIKSGGKTRRAAKMVVLDVDHPDILDFIWCKAREEEKALALRDAGFDMRLDSRGVRLDPVPERQQLGAHHRRVHGARRARRGLGADRAPRRLGHRARGRARPAQPDRRRRVALRRPGRAVRHDDQRVAHAARTRGGSTRRTRASPGMPASTRPWGSFPSRSSTGALRQVMEFGVYTHRATAEKSGAGVVATQPLAVMRNGVKPILRLRFANGQELRCTPNHRLWTVNRGYVHAEELTTEDRVLLNDSPTPSEDAEWALPIKVTALAKSASRGGTVAYQELPETWSEGLGELTGHLIGDGWLTDVQTGWVYGGDDIEDGVADSHEGLLRELVGGVSRQEMDNGTLQLRAGSAAVREFFQGLGVTAARAHEKRVPPAIFTAPAEVQAAFLRGLFGADGCVSRVEAGKANRYVGLGSRSEALLKDAQRLLNAFGVRGRIYRITEPREARFTYTREDGTTVEYASREGFDLRITGSDLERFAEAIGFSTPRKQAALESLLGETTRYVTKPGTAMVSREQDGQEVVYNLTEPLHHSYIVDGVVVANCSEYMHVDDSACNLASLNLMKFRQADGTLDVDALRARGGRRDPGAGDRRRARRATRPRRSASTRARSASSGWATRTWARC